MNYQMKRWQRWDDLNLIVTHSSRGNDDDDNDGNEIKPNNVNMCLLRHIIIICYNTEDSSIMLHSLLAD